MPLWSYAGTWTQYGVLLVLPAYKRTHVNPDRIQMVPSPWVKDDDKGDLVYSPKVKCAGDVYVGLNYAVARPSDKGKIHTETQLLSKLPQILNNPIYRNQRKPERDPPAVILYTRATPCTDCTNAIIQARNQNLNSVGQFIVAYTDNMENSYMNPKINCENRNRLRKSKNPVQVLCVKEEYDATVGIDQCNEDDRCHVNCIIPCFLNLQHNISRLI